MTNQPNANDVSSIIKRLSQAIGVTGYSGPGNIWEAVAAELSPLVEQVQRDRMGSMTGLKPGEQTGSQRRKIMLAAHLDEIGAVVTRLDEGFLRFSPVGGLDARVLMGQEVRVHGRRSLPGLIGSIPPHLQLPGSPKDTVNPDEFFIDVGLPPAEVNQLVRVGDLISFYREPVDLLSGLVSGKALDNRASIAAVVVCLQTLQTLRHRWDVYAVATADEEWGSYVGATTQAYAIRPDVAIALDVTFADVDEIEVKLNNGPVIGLGVGNHPVVRRRLVETCEALEMKYQSEIMPSGAGTDAYAIEVSREGVPTVLISLPSRYMHSPVEVVSLKDVERTGRLLAHFIAGLDEAFVDALTPALE
ncbi:MAG: M42 family metallopeptidase [Anaerolineae bacterium]